MPHDSANAEPASVLNIDYLRLFPEYLRQPSDRSALGADDKLHPGDDGYAMIAESIVGWQGHLH